jgi:hypothetical protein
MSLPQTAAGQRELVIHTGQDRSLIESLTRRLESHRCQLQEREISLWPAACLEPAILHNNWKSWQQQHQRPFWAPWRQPAPAVWVSSQALLRPLLQERRIQRLRPQFERLGVRPVIVVHLLDGRELLARDFARAVLNLRWCGSFEAFVQNMLERDPLRYDIHALFRPLLEWCGALGVRFVLHSTRSRRRPDPGITSLLTLMEQGHPIGPLASIPRHSSQAQTSLRHLRLSQLVLQSLAHPPKGALRRQLLELIARSIGDSSGQDCANLANHLWTPLLGGMPVLPPSIRKSQEQLALKVWGGQWPRQVQRVPATLSPPQDIDQRDAETLREVSALTTRRDLPG